MEFSLGAFFGQDMTKVTLLALEAAPARSFEAFSRPTVTLNFWHFKLPFKLCTYLVVWPGSSRSVLAAVPYLPISADDVLQPSPARSEILATYRS